MYAYAAILGGASMIAFNNSEAEVYFDVVNLGGSDGEGYYKQAYLISQVAFSDIENQIRSNYIGYQIALGSIFRVFSPNLMLGLLVNSFVVVSYSIFLYRIVLDVTGRERAAFFSILLLSLYTPYIFFAVSLLKEPFLNLGIVLVIYGISEAGTSKILNLKILGAFSISAIIFATMRVPFLLVIPFAILLLDNISIPKKVVIVTFLTIGVALNWSSIASMSTHKFDAEWLVDSVESRNLIGYVTSGAELPSGIVLKLIGNYDNWSLFQKILAIPITLLIQYTMPITFWNFSGMNIFVPSIFSGNLIVFWLFLIGPILIYLAITLNGKIITDPTFKKLFIIGLIMYIEIAYVYGGMLPRYAAPFLLFMLPGAGQFLDRCAESKVMRAQLISFIKKYYVIGLFFGTAYVAYGIVR
jgi:hypothetical protein